ncbi:DUF445 domain-containing protein [Alteromonas aestuariivivens]|uniref:DUF445 domain-containing protein n=2 Tax=Alteromonas aestuariivivens TaxID=1938339 RepID=A0A3D8M446_9ALTE|nr:DUF445 domain-containing protein [Alteromonas aestuariivivens]
MAWLIGAAMVFIGASIFKHHSTGQWVELVKMASEAALVGGLADWFAVSALFRPIPPRFSIPHTNIVARNKVAIATELSEFVRDKFFNAEALEILIRQSQPAQGAGRWLRSSEHATKLAHYLADFLAGIIRVVDDKPIQRFLFESATASLRRIDMVPLAEGTLNVLTSDNRHQQVLDQLISQLAKMAEHPDTQVLIAHKLTDWLKEEHRRLEKLLPSGWLSEQGAQIAVRAIVSTLKDIDEDPQHPLRRAFDRYVQEYIERVRNEPELQQKLGVMREKLLENKALKRYFGKVWLDVRNWLLADLANRKGRFSSHMYQALVDLGEALHRDPKLAQAINDHLSEAARYLAPELSEFLTSHIRTTIENWDEREMAEQIELNIGKDLQKVRINGTLVGGTIGAILFFVEFGLAQLPWT